MSRVPEDLICSICSEFCADPVQTSCNHVFCRVCIHSSVSNSGPCPLCRTLITVGRLRSISEVNPILGRIWSKIIVRCPHAVQNQCEWIGSSADFKAHQLTCQTSPVVAAAGSASEMESLRTKCAALQLEVDDLKRQLSVEQRERSRMARQTADERERLQRECELARSLVRVDPTYRYDRYRVVELSQLIAHHLMNKPPDIDSNRIYNCVKNIKDDLLRNWSDNPEHLSLVGAHPSWCSQTMSQQHYSAVTAASLIDAGSVYYSA